MMHKPALFATQSAAVVAVAALHLAALEWYLYWYYPWLDLLSHFLGGLWIALAAVWLLSYASHNVRLLRILAIVAVISIAWEVFEYVAGIPKEANFVFDTSLDFLMDFIGGISGFMLASWFLKNDILNVQ